VLVAAVLQLLQKYIVSIISVTTALIIQLKSSLKHEIQKVLTHRKTFSAPIQLLLVDSRQIITGVEILCCCKTAVVEFHTAAS